MKLSGFRKSVDYYSSKASEISRQLSLAGIAVVWIFKNTENGTIDLPNQIYLPLFLFTLSLAFDLLHYIIGYLIWNSFHRSQEKIGKKDDDDVLAKSWYNYPINVIWGIKIGTTIIGYIFLLIFLFNAR